MSNAQTIALHRTLARRARKAHAVGHVGRKYVITEPISADFVVGTRVTVIREYEGEAPLLCAREDGAALFRIAPETLDTVAHEESDEEREAWLRGAYPHLWY